MRAAKLALALACGLASAQSLSPEQAARLPARTSRPEALRRAKCRLLWRTVAPWSYSEDLCEFFVAEHERQGIGDQWYYSLVYGFSNFGLTIGKRVGPCYGPMDVRQEWARACGYRAAHLRDPRRNIRAHVAEMALYHRRTGETGMALLARVFYPASPRRYRRWGPVDRRFRFILKRGDGK